MKSLPKLQIQHLANEVQVLNNELTCPHAPRVVSRVPDVGTGALVRVRSGLEQQLQELHVRRLLRPEHLGLRIPGPKRPFYVQRREERAGLVVTQEVGVRAAIDERLGQVVITVDDGDQQGTRLVAPRQLIDVCATVEKETRGLDVALSGGVMERGA